MLLLLSHSLSSSFFISLYLAVSAGSWSAAVRSTPYSSAFALAFLPSLLGDPGPRTAGPDSRASASSLGGFSFNNVQLTHENPW